MVYIQHIPSLYLPQSALHIVKGQLRRLKVVLICKVERTKKTHKYVFNNLPEFWGRKAPDKVLDFKKQQQNNKQ